jgi:hypothetical protein
MAINQTNDNILAIYTTFYRTLGRNDTSNTNSYVSITL